jgi:hypothetical protein
MDIRAMFGHREGCGQMDVHLEKFWDKVALVMTGGKFGKVILPDRVAINSIGMRARTLLCCQRPCV